ncbi:LysR family transcriptional regulator [Paracoccus sp. (in: a-proteobacteria)]|uniref:LysR family transcriptional regulator n=1 Tax=Paracoccus sp. TaxID=267 RepID=UPI002AFF84A1|nr:LysR family transcriptional regulator [Paracoccus sp. (in: a-proteobacteria)]
MAVADTSDLRVFVAIAEHRSFRAAARVLGVSPSALSHTMRALEERMAVRLLNRTTRSVSPTDAGERLLLRIRPALADLDDAVTEVASLGDRPTGSLRISAPADAASLIIGRILPRFMAAYPGISVELIIDGRFVDIVAGGFDAGIRLYEAVPKDMIAIRFGPRTLRAIAVASPDYMAGRSVPQVPQDLQQHRCIRYRFESGSLYRWEFEKNGRTINIDVQGPLTVTKMEHGVDAALAGLGIGFLPEPMILGYLASGDLVRFLDDWSPPFEGYCLYYPANRHPPTALRLFAEALRDWAFDEFWPTAARGPASGILEERRPT